jgi:hypothetical protein
MLLRSLLEICKKRKKAMSKETIKMALDELKHIKQWCLRSIGIGLVNENVLTALEEALAKQEQGEPDWKSLVLNHNADCESRCDMDRCGYKPYFEYSKRRCPDCPVHEMIDVEYTTPQPAQKPLTDEQIGDQFVRFQVGGMFTPFLYAVRAIEAAHGIKENT